MELTPKKPVMAGNPPGLMCIVSQGELFQMREIIDACSAALHQIAGYREQSIAAVALSDGGQIVVPTHCAMAMTALSQLFGVEYVSGPPPSDEMPLETAPVGEAQPPVETPPPRAPWKPVVVGGTHG